MKINMLSGEDKKNIYRILELFKPYSKKIVYLHICMIASVIISFFIPQLSKIVMDEGLLATNIEVVIKFSILIFILMSIGQGFSFLEVKFESYLSTEIPYEFNLRTIKKIMSLKMSYLNKNNSNQLLGNMNMDVANICILIDRRTFDMLMQVFTMVGGILGLLVINWKLAMIIFVVIPLRYYTVKKLSDKRKKNHENYMKNTDDYWGWYGDTMTGIKEIKLLGIQEEKIKEYDQIKRRIMGNDKKFLYQDKINHCLESITLSLVNNIIYIMGAYLVFSGQLTIGGLTAFITYSLRVSSPLSRLIGIKYNYTKVLPAAKRYFEFMDMETEEDDGGNIQLDRNFDIEEICFDNVGFSYNSDRVNLKDINFNIKAGEKVAVIGMNGSGKTTLINLLLRFENPQYGKIRINGIDVRDIKIKDYRELMSVVSQDFYLFNSSIEENIAYKKEITSERVEIAVKKSGVKEFIDKQSKTVETVIGSDGVFLSGGERQKVALARVLASNSKIIVFDEGTSNVDVESENMINEVLVRELKDETVIIISHKPQVLKYVDKIVVLEDGGIKDIGSYDELIDKDILKTYLVKN